MKNNISTFIFMIIMIALYYIIRYPPFHLHMMKSWPYYIFMVGLIIIFISGIIKHNRIIPIFTVLGYVLGFIFSYIFQFDYEKDLNSMWIIWTCFYIASIFIGILITIFLKKYRKNKKGA